MKRLLPILSLAALLMAYTIADESDVIKRSSAHPVTFENENADTTQALLEHFCEHLEDIGPVERLRVYRIRLLDCQGEWSPKGYIFTRHNATLEAAYGSSSPAEEEVQIMTAGGAIDGWKETSSGGCLELNRSYVLGLTGFDYPGYDLVFRDPGLVGHPRGDSIDFPWMSVTVDSAGLFEIVRSIQADTLSSD